MYSVFVPALISHLPWKGTEQYSQWESTCDLKSVTTGTIFHVLSSDCSLHHFPGFHDICLIVFSDKGQLTLLHPYLSHVPFGLFCDLVFCIQSLSSSSFFPYLSSWNLSLLNTGVLAVLYFWYLLLIVCRDFLLLKWQLIHRLPCLLD